MSTSQYVTMLYSWKAKAVISLVDEMCGHKTVIPSSLSSAISENLKDECSV